MNRELIIKQISQELELPLLSLENTITLFDEGATIPFIARYRKERTGNLNEIVLKNIITRYEYFLELEKRKETVLKTIDEQGKLTDQLRQKIVGCMDKQLLEDLYLPYKPKKRTRAQAAREKGLQGLADIMRDPGASDSAREKILASFINEKDGAKNADEALQGAIDIIAEELSEDSVVREKIRSLTSETGMLEVSPKKEWKDKKSKFENYYNFNGLLCKEPSHRVLAIRRGVKEGVLSDKLLIDSMKSVSFIQRRMQKDINPLFKNDVKGASEESFKRLIYPSIEKEVFNIKLEQSEKEAIDVFATNLEKMLLAAPAGQKVIMGLDPGFRTGCKVVVIDKHGTFKEYKNIFPVEPFNKVAESEKVVLELIKKYDVEIIAIGNGTASKESDAFIRTLIQKHKLGVLPVVVSEAGASVYSASEKAVEEFPDLDVTVRGAISIARRLQDPLSELVKIDPGAIGVGQYQHDVNQKLLKSSLEMSVESAVNRVGVELNTASAELLSYVAGVGKKLADEIVKYREEVKGFKNRKELLKVPKFGKKAFEQSAGFLRIRGASHVLDNSAIHPESYHLVEAMARDLKVKVDALVENEDLIKKIDIKKYVTDTVGLPTLGDIIEELKKPARDPRDTFKQVEFSSAINTIEDLQEEMELDGVVTNVTNFGAFTDIGVHQDGLIHISKLSDSFVNNPHDVIAVGDIVRVRVLSVDVDLKRISLERIGAATSH